MRVISSKDQFTQIPAGRSQLRNVSRENIWLRLNRKLIAVLLPGEIMECDFVSGNIYAKAAVDCGQPLLEVVTL